MTSLRFNKIFYKDDRESLESYTRGIEERESILKSAILPICPIKWALPLYREVLSHIKKGSKIVILSPLHRENLIEDKEEVLFSYPESEIESEIGIIKVNKGPFKDGSVYRDEEPGGELLLPLLKSHFGSVDTKVVFTQIKSAKDIKRAETLLKPLIDEKTVLIIMGNLTYKTDKMTQSADKSVSFILSGERLLDKFEKNEAPFLAAPLIELSNRLIKGRWVLIEKSLSNDKEVAHGALYKV